MRTFYLLRETDPTGVSGTGFVAEGVEFTDGTVALRWTVPDKPASTVLYASLADVRTIHGHDGATTIAFPRARPLDRVEIVPEGE